ncbi:hypothetical protein HWV62_43961 [Athelia sp. TMB]|nr:hypothetical protein HWV62_43961 [Athelia sp. TMB]
MPKLHLKRTPAEEAEHQWRKEHKAARRTARGDKPKSKRHRNRSLDRDETRSRSSSSSRSHKRSRRDTITPPRDINNTLYDSDEDIQYGPQPSTSYGPDYEAIRAQLEEERFREKMYGAYEDDVGLYGVAEQMNQFAYVPDRWRGPEVPGAKGVRLGDETGPNPQLMDDEEYAEWVRHNMWKKKHADEHAEQLRREAQKTERRAKEKAMRQETSRLEREIEAERQARKGEKERRRQKEARESYEQRWKDLIAEGVDGPPLIFSDIPWPIYEAQSSAKRPTAGLALNVITVDAIARFILSGPPTAQGLTSDATEKKDRKERLRETMLRFHPDKFEGRLMRRVKEDEQVKVREAVGQVVRALNTLMGEGT